MQFFGRHLLAATAACAVMLGASSAYADVKSGVDAWQAGNFGAAVSAWRPLADQGDPDAQFNLGQAYKLGRGVPAADLNTAQAWYLKAAQQGHSQAQANLGLILFQSGNRGGAMPWIKKAADAGDPRAQYVFGTALFNGDLVAKDWPRAYAMMQRSAAQGLPQAASNLEQMDRFIPLPQRKQGLALAQQLERSASAAQAAPAAARPTPRASGPVTAYNLPPSRPAQQVAITPAPVRSAPASSRAAAPSGGWRVQLGAYGNAANARGQWNSLKSKVGALASLQPALVSAGAVTRLQAGPIPNRAAADRVCAAAKAAGSACFPVAP